MEQITILVRDQGKARSLLDLLRSLDFVSILNIENIDATVVDPNLKAADEEEFFAAAGIWKDRDITVESLRSVAWPRQTK